MKQGRKKFEKIGLGNPRPAAAPNDDQSDCVRTKPSNTHVKFTKPVSRVFDFAPWYGGGIDRITHACQDQVERFLRGQDAEYSQRSIHTYCKAGLKSFLEYSMLRAAALQRELAPLHIDREFIDGYIAALDGMGKALVTKKSKFISAKVVLRALCNRGVIEEVLYGDDATFPRNPFPGAHRNSRSHRPLTADERRAFAQAIKKAVLPIFEEGAVATSHLLAYALLVIALHTGRNTTPLLEMSSDCLRPHPKSGAKFLVLFKRRSNSESKVVLKESQVSENGLDSIATLRPTVVDLINRVISLSDELRRDAPQEIGDLVWLYRTATGRTGRIAALSEDMLALAIKELVKNYNLVDADGQPMHINVSRLRKSFVNRIYEILDGDVAATSAAAGSTPRVLGMHYLRPSEEATKNWMFMGKTLVTELLAGTVGDTERTPVARCTNIKSGEYAPKRDALLCTSFLNCIRCRNLVVTADDLYRLFSFYWRVLHERSRMDVRRWKRQMSHIVRLIDREVIEPGIARGVFKQAVVDEERRRAFATPHPFWRTGIALSDLGSLGSL